MSIDGELFFKYSHSIDYVSLKESMNYMYETLDFIYVIIDDCFSSWILNYLTDDFMFGGKNDWQTKYFNGIRTFSTVYADDWLFIWLNTI